MRKLMTAANVLLILMFGLVAGLSTMGMPRLSTALAIGALPSLFFLIANRGNGNRYMLVSALVLNFCGAFVLLALSIAAASGIGGVIALLPIAVLGLVILGANLYRIGEQLRSRGSCRP